MAVLGMVALGLVVLAVAALTAIGERRRGGSILLAVVAGVFFPATWVIWYVRDQRPFRRARPQPAGDDALEQWQLVYQQVAAAADRIAQAAGARIEESSCDFTPSPGRLHIDLVLDFGDRSET